MELFIIILNVILINRLKLMSVWYDKIMFFVVNGFIVSLIVKLMFGIMIFFMKLFVILFLFRNIL